MRTFFSLAFLLLASYSLLATDSLLFRSNFERSQIQLALQGPEVNYIALYSAIDADSTTFLEHVSKLEMFYRYMTPKIDGQRSSKQKAKLIFKEVHNQFFRQYDEDVTFDRIFRDGKYNCVTASMLYAVVLQHYGVPYEIKEKPTHVYIVAFPATDNILFETTNPRGLFVPDEKSKRAFVDGLVTAKFTTREHVSSVGMERAFNEFYYNNGSISLIQLAGIQYYNRSIYLHAEEKTDEAIRNVLLVNLLYPSSKHQYLKLAYLNVALKNSHFETEKDIFYLCEYANSSRDVSDRKLVISTFEQILSDQLYKKSNETFVKEAYEIVKSRFQDKDMLKDITYDYLAGMSYWTAMKGDATQSLEYAGQAFDLNPKDVRLQDVIVRDIVLKTEKLKGKQKNIDQLNAYAARFPFLTNHGTFRTLMIYQLGLASYGLFLENEGTEGYKYLNQMEQALKEDNEKVSTLDQLIGMAYAEAGAYHFRRKEYKEAKKIILRGLEIVPDHGELKERLKIVEDESR